MPPRVIALVLLCAVGAQPTSFTVPFESDWLPSKLPGTDSKLFVFEDQEFRRGFIDANGTVVIAPSFEGHVGNFVNGLANVAGSGYIDEQGNWVIQGDFFTTADFSDGLAKVEFTRDVGSEMSVSYIDKAGRVAFRTSRFRTGDFSEGMTWYQAPGVPSGETAHVGPFTVNTDYPGLYGFVDRTGTIAIEPRFYSVGRFSEGLAAASPEGHCYVDTHDGPTPVEMPWTQFTTLASGGWGTGPGVVCPVGFIDSSGNFSIRPQFEDALDFAEGRAGVQVGRRWGFIDRDGNVVVAPKYGEVRSFREGLAAVELDGEWGFIDVNGQVVIEPQFTWVDSFSDSLCRAGRLVEGHEELFYIDREGQIAILGPFAEATPFVNGLAAVLYPHKSDDQEVGVSYINKLGGIVFTYPR